MTPRFSVCLEASDVSAPATHSCDFCDVPETSRLSSGSIPPSLAMVSLLGALSVESDQSAYAD